MQPARLERKEQYGLYCSNVECDILHRGLIDESLPSQKEHLQIACETLLKDVPLEVAERIAKWAGSLFIAIPAHLYHGNRKRALYHTACVVVLDPLHVAASLGTTLLRIGSSLIGLWKPKFAACTWYFLEYPDRIPLYLKDYVGSKLQEQSSNQSFRVIKGIKPKHTVRYFGKEEAVRLHYLSKESIDYLMPKVREAIALFKEGLQHLTEEERQKVHEKIGEKPLEELSLFELHHFYKLYREVGIKRYLGYGFSPVDWINKAVNNCMNVVLDCFNMREDSVACEELKLKELRSIFSDLISFGELSLPTTQFFGKKKPS